MPRLKKEVIRSIKDCLKIGKLSNIEIAGRFNVSIRTIQNYRISLGINVPKGRPFK